MISQVLCEEVPDKDPFPYIPTFYQFSDFIEHTPAADVSFWRSLIGVYNLLTLFPSGAIDATTFIPFVLSRCAWKCLKLGLWSLRSDNNITKDF